jgi:predicted SPOUT superfamily RNA methylase MTH1
MRELAKGNVMRVKAKTKAASIIISCKNSKGNLIRKSIVVGNRRVIRHVAHQPFVITPVLKEKLIVGYAIEGQKKLNELYRQVRGDVEGGVGRREPRRRVPKVNREVYDVSVLPDGMYICNNCNNFVKSGHRCPNSM